mgnify:CR=1 FL=1
MTSIHAPEILISEVGPRDGLQSVKATMPTADKLRWIDALVASGLALDVVVGAGASSLPALETLDVSDNRLAVSWTEPAALAAASGALVIYVKFHQ